MLRKVLVWGALLVVAAFAADLARKKLLEAGILKYNKYDRRERGSLRAGDATPDLTLGMYDGSGVRLSELWRARPVFLVFGSCT